MSARQRARLLQSKQLAAIGGDDSSDAEDDYQVKRKPRKQKKAPAPAFSLPIGSSDEDDSDASRDSDKEDEGSASPKDDTNFTSAVPERQPSNDSIFEDSSDDESPAVLVQKPSTFTQLIDSSSSSDDDTDDVPLQQIAATAPVNKKKSAVLSSVEQTTDDQDAAAFLEEQIRKNEELQAAIAADESNAVNRRKAFEDSESILFTKIDPKQLNWDNIVRNRFGGGGLGDLNVNDVGNNQRNAPTRGNRMFSHRRWLFGQPDDDWGKPPSIIGGGMGMTRLHTEYLPGSTTKEILYNVFTFKWSKEYHKLATLYQIAKATGDPNYLVMFLANYPYYAEGFIDLGYIFFQMGLVERGLQCFRRVLYLYECASMEAFRPHLGQSRLLMTSDASLSTKKAQPSSSNGSDDGSGRDEDEFDFDERSDDEGDVDSLRDELNANEDNDDAQFADDEPNRVYLRALWRFLQAVNMQGQIPLAANLATMILALNPTDDVVHILLSLDYFLLQAGKYSEVTRMCGMALEPTTLGEVRAMQRRKNNSDDNSSSDSSDDESSPAVSAEDQRKRIVDLVQHHWHRAYVIHKPSSPSSTAAEAHDGGGSLHTAYAVDKLPNWWFSAALAVHLSVLERELARQYDATASPEPELTSLLWSRSTADTLLQQALRRWPSVGWELFIRNYTQQDTLSASGVHSGHLYERMKLLGFYFTATSTTSAVATVLQPPPLEAHEEHIIQCFLTRCAQSAQLWARREVWSWFVANLERTATAIEAIVTLTNDTNTTPAVVAEAVTAFHRFYGGSDRPTPMDPSMPALEGEAANPLVKYSTAELTDFEAEIPRLRLEGVQPIDAQLMEERVLAGGVKFKKLDKHLLSMKSQLQWRKVQGRWIAAQEEHHRAAAFAGAPQDQPENNNANDSNSTLNRMFDMTLPVALVLFLISLVFWLVMVWRNARQVTSP